GRDDVARCVPFTEGGAAGSRQDRRGGCRARDPRRHADAPRASPARPTRDRVPPGRLDASGTRPGRLPALPRAARLPLSRDHAARALPADDDRSTANRGARGALPPALNVGNGLRAKLANALLMILCGALVLWVRLLPLEVGGGTDSRSPDWTYVGEDGR